MIIILLRFSIYSEIRKKLKNPFTNPAPGLGDCFLSNIFSLQVQIVEAILNHPEGFISATRQLVKLLHRKGIKREYYHQIYWEIGT